MQEGAVGQRWRGADCKKVSRGASAGRWRLHAWDTASGQQPGVRFAVCKNPPPPSVGRQQGETGRERIGRARLVLTVFMSVAGFSLLSVVSAVAANFMPGPRRFPSADLYSVLERPKAVRRRETKRTSSGTASRQGDTGGSPPSGATLASSPCYLPMGCSRAYAA